LEEKLPEIKKEIRLKLIDWLTKKKLKASL